MHEVYVNRIKNNFVMLLFNLNTRFFYKDQFVMKTMFSVLRNWIIFYSLDLICLHGRCKTFVHMHAIKS